MMMVKIHVDLWACLALLYFP